MPHNLHCRRQSTDSVLLWEKREDKGNGGPHLIFTHLYRLPTVSPHSSSSSSSLLYGKGVSYVVWKIGKTITFALSLRHSGLSTVLLAPRKDTRIGF
ncbi:hypothetical protein V2J09_001563 [Rumex salicifolius]